MGEPSKSRSSQRWPEVIGPRRVPVRQEFKTPLRRSEGKCLTASSSLQSNGRLHPNGIPEWGPWEASRLHWWREDNLDLVLSTTGERKVRTIEELKAAIREPMRVAPTRNIWLHESLEDEAIRVCGRKWPSELEG